MQQDSALLVGLWELEGYSRFPGGEMFQPPPGTDESLIREFLYFASDSTFFFVKFAASMPLTFDVEKQRLISEPPIKPVLQGTWAIEGNDLVEQATDREGGNYENRFEIAELNDDRLLIMEPTRSGKERLTVEYQRNSVEQFPAPTLEDAGTADETEDDVVDADSLQHQINTIGELVADAKLNSAHRLAQECVRRSTQAFGPEHPSTAACRSTLGAVLAKVGESTAAIVELERSFEILSANRRTDPLELATALNNLSLAYTEDGQCRLALATAIPAVRTRGQKLGFGSETALVAIQNLGRALSNLGYVGFAHECYRAQEALANESGIAHKQAAAKSNRETLEIRVAANFPFVNSFKDERTDLGPEPALLRVLSEAHLLIASYPKSEDMFVIACAQAADPTSYFNLVHAMRTEQRKNAKAKDGDIADRVERAQGRVIKACGVPLTRFIGPVQRIGRLNLGPIGMRTLEHAFPNFGGGVEKKRRLDEDLEPVLGPERPETFAERQVRRAEAIGYRTKWVDEQSRRFAGAHNLPRQRYSALHSDSGPDGTLERELFEYTEPNVPGEVFVGSTSDAELMSAGAALGLPDAAAGRDGIFVFLIPPIEDAERHVYRKVYGPIFEQAYGPYVDGNPAWDSLAINFIPVQSETIDAPRVLDLRQRDAQDWFSRFFRRGDGAVFEKTLGPDIDSFRDMLPAIVYPEFGGSGFTKSVGTWMRTVGIDGLVYPSARSDAAVLYDAEGNLATWHGWNFVDYRDLEFVPDSQMHSDDNPWSVFVAARQAAPTLETSDRGWRICGAEQRYQMIRELLVELLSSPKTKPLK